MIEIRPDHPPDAGLVQKLTEAWTSARAAGADAFVQVIQSDETWDAIEKRLEECRDVEKALVIGIGGSSLGTQSIYDSFSSTSAAEIFFLESADRHRWDLLRNLGGDWRDRHIVIVSKSGNTLETLTWVEKLAYIDQSWIKPEQCTVIASPGEGELQSWAKTAGLPCLWIPADLGGRFSVLSAVGMFPAGLMGLSRFEFREGARWALTRLDLAAQLAAVTVRSWERGEMVTHHWTYSEALRSFGQWWQQLWAESLAKKVTRSGGPAPAVSTPLPCLGPRDQHSLLQLVIEGQTPKHVFLTRVREVESQGESFEGRLFAQMPFYQKAISLGSVLGAEAQAFERALLDNRIPVTAIELDGLNERTFGALFMLWQMTIALLGEHLNINAYNQPGVEFGKKHADKILRQ